MLWFSLLVLIPLAAVVVKSAEGGWDTFADAVRHQQAKQMDDDALAILGRGPQLVPGEEGVRDMRVVDAIYASARDGGRRIVL